MGRRRIYKPAPNPSGLCMCGCGRTTPVALLHRPKKNHVRGCHTLFCLGHGARTARPEFIINPVTGCWIWQRAKDGKGYGIAHREDRTTTPAHRLIYERLVGPVPDDLPLHHKCLTKLCCNPEHQLPISDADHKKLHARLRRGVVMVKPGETYIPGSGGAVPPSSRPSVVVTPSLGLVCPAGPGRVGGFKP